MSVEIERSEVENPELRVGSKAILQVADRVLLVKERHSDGTPFWTLPGGGVKDNESRAAALQRELKEELRCTVEVNEAVTQFLYAHMSSKRLSVYTAFDCELHAVPSPNLLEGVFDKQWARPEQLPAATLLPVRQLIKTYVCENNSV